MGELDYPGVIPADLAAETAARLAADAALTSAVAAESATRAGADSTIAAAAAAAQATANAALPRAGGTMTGALILPGDPAGLLEAAPRQYVLAQITAAIDAVVNGAPGALDTLKELADKLTGDEGSLIASLAAKADKAANLADLADAVAARSNLGLGSAAVHPSTDFGTSAQGALADALSGVPTYLASGSAAALSGAASTVILSEIGSGAASSAGSKAFYFDPADYAVAGKVLRLRLRASIWTNDTAPLTDVTLAMASTGNPSGGAGVVGASFSSVGNSAIVIPSASLTANTKVPPVSVDFAPPVAGAGWYGFRVSWTPTMATNATISARLLLSRFYQAP